MAQGRGYVCVWRVVDVGGIIHVCEGDNLVGRDVAFPFARCSKEVKDVLRLGDIDEDVDCPPPDGALRVSFDFDIVNGHDLAVNVRR